MFIVYLNVRVYPYCLYNIYGLMVMLLLYMKYNIIFTKYVGLIYTANGSIYSYHDLDYFYSLQSIS